MQEQSIKFVVVVLNCCNFLIIIFIFLLFNLANSAMRNNIAGFCFSCSQAPSFHSQLCLLQTGVALLVDFSVRLNC